MALGLEKKRRLMYGTNAIVLTAAVVVSSLLIYEILQKKHIRWDLTANKEQSLSEQSEKTLQNLGRKVTITAFFRRGQDAEDVFVRRKVDDTLREYAARSPKIEYRMVDSDVEIELTIQYGITIDGTVVFQSGKNKKEVYRSQLFDYSQVGEAEEKLPEFTGEGLFTNAILKVTRDTQQKICLLEGHGERRSDDTSPKGFSQTKDYLSKNNYETEALPLLSKEKLDSCVIAILAGPSVTLTDPEDTLLKDWVESYGRLLILLEPLTPVALPKTLGLLKVQPEADLVFDPSRHFVLGPHYPAPILADHEITREIQTMNPILFSARGLSIPKEEETHAALLTTSPESWGETDLSGAAPKFNVGKDKKGPLTLGVAVKKDRPTAVVVGDADFASNGLVQAPGNLDLFLNMIGWLSGNTEQVAIRPKTPEFRNLTLTAGRAHFVSYFTQLVYPLIVLLGGGFYWYRRRHA